MHSTPPHTHTPPTPSSMYLHPGFVMITWFLHVITILKGFKLRKSEMWRKYSLNNYNRVHLLKHRLWLCEKQAALKVQQVFAERGRRMVWAAGPALHLPAALGAHGSEAPAPAGLAEPLLLQHKPPFSHCTQGDFITWWMMQITEYETYNDTNSHLKTKLTRKSQHGRKLNRIFQLNQDLNHHKTFCP